MLNYVFFFFIRRQEVFRQLLFCHRNQILYSTRSIFLLRACGGGIIQCNYRVCVCALRMMQVRHAWFAQIVCRISITRHNLTYMHANANTHRYQDSHSNSYITPYTVLVYAIRDIKYVCGMAYGGWMNVYVRRTYRRTWLDILSWPWDGLHFFRVLPCRFSWIAPRKIRVDMHASAACGCMCVDYLRQRIIPGCWMYSVPEASCTCDKGTYWMWEEPQN